MKLRFAVSLGLALASSSSFASADEPAKAAADGAPDPKSEVVVTVHADDPNATLEKRTGSQSLVAIPGLQSGLGQVGTWEAACVAPCKTAVDPRFAYRIAGEGLVPSDTFTVPRDGRALHLDAEMGQSHLRMGGAGLVGAGIGALLLGGAAMIATPIFERDQTGSPFFRDTVRDGGYVALAAGTVAATIGLYLWLSNGTSVREDKTELAKRVTANGIAF